MAQFQAACANSDETACRPDPSWIRSLTCPGFIASAAFTIGGGICLSPRPYDRPCSHASRLPISFPPATRTPGNSSRLSPVSGRSPLSSRLLLMSGFGIRRWDDRDRLNAEQLRTLEFLGIRLVICERRRFTYPRFVADFRLQHVSISSERRILSRINCFEPCTSFCITWLNSCSVVNCLRNSVSACFRRSGDTVRFWRTAS